MRSPTPEGLTMMTPDQLREIAERVSKPPRNEFGFTATEELEFASHARQDIEDLLEEILRLTDENCNLKAIIQEVPIVELATIQQTLIERAITEGKIKPEDVENAG